MEVLIAKINGLVTLVKTRKLIDQSTCNQIYKQTILPYFDYIYLVTEFSLRKKIRNYNFCKIMLLKLYFILRRYEYICFVDMLLLHEKLE